MDGLQNGAAGRKRVTVIDRPKNPYKKMSLIWSLMEGDWEDLTTDQMAEVLDADINSIRSLLRKIEQDTGYKVLYVRRRKKKEERRK